MRRLSLLALAALACSGAPRPPGGPGQGPAAGAPGAPGGPAEVAEAARALERFATAVAEGRWEAAYALLASPWRARETPARLAADLRASGAVGADAVQRVRALLAAGARPEVRGTRARLEVGADRVARLVREEGGWRVEALE